MTGSPPASPQADTSSALQVSLAGSLDAIPAKQWDALAGHANPLTSHAFLMALEKSGSVDGEESGWISRHLQLEQDGALVGVAPAYVKLHSYGEYVFDWGWAEAFERAGGRYYPKLQVALPFTPATGRRLLGAPELWPSFGEGLKAAAEQLKLSGVHLTFCEAEEARALESRDFMTRTGIQFHWHNRDYQSFDDFLATLKSSKRKAVRKERREAEASGLTLVQLTGDAITAEHWDFFYAFYQDTSDRKWGQAYLTRDFFHQLHESLRDQILLCLALDGETPVAGALNFIGSERLFGRYWGCLESYKFLHFELCYYQAIDYAIAHGIQVVEAGAQGPHKLQRGYEPVLTYSSHWLSHPGLSDAIKGFLTQERQQIAAQRDHLLAEASPYAQRV